VNDGRLSVAAGPSTVSYHDPCYLGRHTGVYDAPRNLLNILSNSVVELPRNRENSFCCGAGGAQFWKEEEPGNERISENRYREAEQQLKGAQDKVLAVGCPFCKSMLESTPGKGSEALAVRDVAELLLEGVQRSGRRDSTDSAILVTVPPQVSEPHFSAGQSQPLAADAQPTEEGVGPVNLSPESIPTTPDLPALYKSSGEQGETAIPVAPAGRKAWNPKPTKTLDPPVADPAGTSAATGDSPSTANEPAAQAAPSSPLPDSHSDKSPFEPTPLPQPAEKRKAWAPKRKMDD
jgi:hypothetical protein